MNIPIDRAEQSVDVSQRRSSRAKHAHSATARSFSRLHAVGYAPFVAVACYVGGGIWAYWPSSLFGSKSIGGSLDAIGQVWALSWTAYAISHHLNPFFTSAVNYPFGANLADNGIVPLVGLLLYPITHFAGAVVATNVAFPLAFITAATSMYFVTRLLVQSEWAAFLAGLAYGFSPYMVAAGSGHITLVFTPLLPIIFYLLLDIFGRQRMSARKAGIALGFVVALQVYLSTELLADAGLVTLLCVVIAGIRYRDAVRNIARRVLEAGMWAIGVFVVIAGYPIWFSIAGTNHISGPAQPVGAVEIYHADLLGPIVPTYAERFAPAHLATIGAHYVLGNVSENGSYIGLPLLIAVIIIAIWLRSSAIVRMAVMFSVIAFIFSLGTRLAINNHVFPVPLPFDVLTRLPLVDSEVPTRYSLFVQFSVVLIFAIGIDEAFRRLRGWAASGGEAHSRARWRQYVSSHRRFGWPGLAGVGALILLPLVPNLPYGSTPTNVPSFFTSSLIDRIPEGSVVLTYPYPQPYSLYQPMMWQAVSNMHFKLLGGYALIPGGSAGTPWPPPLEPLIVQDLFDDAAYGIPASPNYPPVGNPLVPVEAAYQQMRIFMVRYHVQTVIADPVGQHPELAISYLSVILGKPRTIQGIKYWFHVPSRLVRHKGAS